MADIGTANILHNTVLWSIALPPVNRQTEFLQPFLVSVHLSVSILELNKLPLGKKILQAS